MCGDRPPVTDVAGWHGSTLLGRLDNKNSALLRNLGTAQHFVPDQTIIAQGDPSDSVVLLLSGGAKSTVEVPGGASTLLELHAPGDLLGELAALDQRERTCTALAFGHVRARVIETAELRRLLVRYPQVAIALLNVHARQQRWSVNRRADHSLYDAQTRVLRVLDQLYWDWCFRQCKTSGVEVPLGQDELGQIAGTGKRTTQLVLKQLQELKILRQGYRKVFITDPGKLHAAVETQDAFLTVDSTDQQPERELHIPD